MRLCPVFADPVTFAVFHYNSLGKTESLTAHKFF